MDWLKKKIFETESFAQIGGFLNEDGPLLVKNAPGALPVLIADYLSEQCERPVLMAAETLEDAEEILDDLTVLLGETRPCLLPGLPQYGRAPTTVEQSERAEVLLELLRGERPLVVTTAAALIDPLPAADAVSRNMYTITSGETLPRDSLLQHLADSGYEREIFVESVGQFAVRGAVLDIYPFGMAQPVRIEFFDDDVESMRTFDPVSQRSTGEIRELTLLAAEMPDIDTTHLFEHLPENTVIVWAGGRAAWAAVKAAFDEETELRKDSGITPEMLFGAAKQYKQVFLGSSPLPEAASVDLKASPQERFAANLPLVADRLKEYHAAGLQAVLLCDSDLAGERLAQVLIERGCPEEAFEIQTGGLHHGFTVPEARLALLVDHDIFGRIRRKRRFVKFKNVVPLHDIDALKPGDFVVHVDYGIGRYEGLTTIEVGGHRREVLKILYRDDVKLFVRLESLAQIQKYSGREGFQPPLSRIGGRDWRDLKKKTRKSLVSIAEDLIKLYAKRRSVPGIAFSPDSPWQREMEASFPYEDTPDQFTAAENVKGDMERSMPMDRLICGDVGYGKTEVAMRAAFKAVTDGKQVAVLVPTTILAQQHHRTFRERFRSWPIRVEVLSRFQTRGEQRQTLKRLAHGEADILIGTHRMLSRDVAFKNLGLLIVDEEHRFGVVQKEKIKSLRSNVDVLSMSATPIPRTLHMALMGARDLSQINTPPPNRLPIETDVVQFSEKVIKDAITYEVGRGGQVFFIHNRVQSIPAVKRLLTELLPRVRFGVAHGQMDEMELSRVMVDFLEGNYDVLVSTMIVESGLDLPNVNTMIVNRADRFGVAQLHQLRGRIGRSSRKAYAFLLVPPNFEISRVARKRLAALTNFSSLGAGFQVAMRDLEIRGAGNLLGREQSGYINAVGFEMYQRLIEEAVREVKLEDVENGNGAAPPPELKVQLEADAFFPEDYMPEGSMRLNFYRELSRAADLERVNELLNEVEDRFGRLPEDARNLFDMMRVKLLGERLEASEIDIQAPELRVRFDPERISRDRLMQLAAAGDSYPVEFSAVSDLTLRLPLGNMQEWREKLEHVVGYLQAVTA